MNKNQTTISILLDTITEKTASNVLIDSLYQNSSIPISITPLVTDQLRKLNLYWRKKTQSKVPIFHLQGSSSSFDEL